MVEEQWRWIAGYEGHFKISDRGNVLSVPRTYQGPKNKVTVKRPRILRPTTVKGGYRQIQLWRGHEYRCFYVARLVVAAFVRPLEPEEEVNHEDGDTGNNWLSNLEIMTHPENMKHAVHVIKTVKPPLHLYSRHPFPA